MSSVKSQIESLLFISHKPLTVSELSKLSGADKKQVQEELESLAGEYKERGGGIAILQAEEKYQMSTAGENSEIVSKFVKNEMTGELTRPSLETLTIIAYRGPVSKAELELIRGVNCSMILRNLLIRGLIEAKDNKEKMTTVYNVTLDFLKYLGLTGVNELPDFEKLNRNNNLDKLLEGLGSSELPLAKEIKETVEEVKD